MSSHMIKGLLACMLMICGKSMVSVAQSISSVTGALQQLIERSDASVGVAAIVDGKDTIVVHNEDHYPLMSVMKLHQALAVCHELRQKGQTLNLSLYISTRSLKPDTYSPMRERYPEGNLFLTVKELLDYSLKMSDNNACDILFDWIGGPQKVDSYIRSLGLNQFAVAVTEEEMHQNPETSHLNWTSPLDAVLLVEKLLKENILDSDDKKYIFQAMLDCTTGKDRLWKPLEKTAGLRLGHKTGTGTYNREGRLTGINDVGFVLLPDGRYYTIAVLVKDSGMSLPATSQLIADISGIIYQYVCTQSVSE